MLKVSHTTMMILSGLVWLIVGLILFPLGLNFLVTSILNENLSKSRPLLDSLAPLLGDLDVAVLAVLIVSIVIGCVKGKFVFGKAVDKGMARIKTLSDPAPIKYLYTRKYYILLGSMMLLGFLVKYAPLDIRGFVDVAVGSALIYGAILYFVGAYQNSRKLAVVRVTKD